MAVESTLDLEQISTALGRWLRGPLGAPDARVEGLAAPGASGFSADTLLFDVASTVHGTERREPFVARVAPRGPGLFPTYDLAAEARVITALREHTNVPVADLVGLELDATVIGAPFYVMRRTPGRIPQDDPPYTASGWVVDLPVEERGRVWDTFVDVLADVHAVDTEALGLGFLARPEDGPTAVDQGLAELERYYAFASDGRRDSAVVDAGLDWLRANRPADQGRVALSWGDCHPHNMVYADDLSAAAALDWEMMALASPELDLAFLTFALRLYTEGMGISRPEGVPDRDALVARYVAAGGDAPRHLGYYETWNAVRVSLILMRMGRLMIAAGLLPADATMPIANPASKLLAEMLGLPESDLAVQDWSGVR